MSITRSARRRLAQYGKPALALRQLRPACMLALLLVFSGCAGIQSPPGEETYLDDETITSRVQQALAESLGAQISSIKVQTFKGVVLLSGEVASENLRKRAVAITGDVEGVEFVKDKLELTEPGR